MLKLQKVVMDRVLNLKERLPLVNASDSTTVVAHPGRKVHFNYEYIKKLKRGRINVIHLSFTFWPWDSFYFAIKRLYGLYTVLKKYRKDLTLVIKYENIKEAIMQDKISVIIHSHSPCVIDDDLGLLLILYKLGLRVIQPAYQGRNLVSDGCGERDGAGLSSFGIKFVEESNRLGILIDLAHSGPRTYTDVLDYSKDPVIYSHGCALALCNEPKGRHLTDEQIHALAEKDGVIGIMGIHLIPKVTSEGKLAVATIEDYMRHLQYIVDLVGVNHVGIGLEIGYSHSWEDEMALRRGFKARFHDPYQLTSKEADEIQTPTRAMGYNTKGLQNPSKLKINLISKLVARGYSDQEIGKILSGNFFRIYKRVW